MSISHDIHRAEAFRSGEEVAHEAEPLLAADTPEPEDRRSARRVVSAFRPGCVLAEGRMLLGIIRNLSAGGVMIELDVSLEPGTPVRYFWDETNVIDAVVAWREGRAHGLENADAARPFANPFPYRSVRVPCAMDALLYLGGERHRAVLENLSLGGMRVSGFAAPHGALLTVRLGHVELTNATVRWCRDGEAGIRFERPLTRAQLAVVLAEMGAEADLETDMGTVEDIPA